MVSWKDHGFLGLTIKLADNVTFRCFVLFSNRNVTNVDKTVIVDTLTTNEIELQVTSTTTTTVVITFTAATTRTIDTTINTINNNTVTITVIYIQVIHYCKITRFHPLSVLYMDITTVTIKTMYDTN